MCSREVRVGSPAARLMLVAILMVALQIGGCSAKASKRAAQQKAQQAQSAAVGTVTGEIAAEVADLCKNYVTMFDPLWKSGGFGFETDVTIADFDTRTKTIKSLIDKHNGIVAFLEASPKSFREKIAAGGYPADKLDQAVSGFEVGLHLDMQKQIRDLDMKVMRSAIERFDILRSNAGHWTRQSRGIYFAPEFHTRDADRYQELTTQLRDAWNDKSDLQQKLIDAGTTMATMTPTGPMR